MCLNCTNEVAIAGDYLDELLKVDKELRQASPELTEAQNTIRLACTMLEAYDESSDQRQALKDMALGFALCVTRLFAAQDIYGMPAS